MHPMQRTFTTLVLCLSAMGLARAEKPESRPGFPTTCTPDSNVSSQNARFDPSCFVNIYEDVGPAAGNRRILLYSPEMPEFASRALTADLNSYIHIDRSRFWEMNRDISLNKLFLRAELLKTGKQTPVEVVGYSEIGVDEEKAASQKAFGSRAWSHLAP